MNSKFNKTTGRLKLSSKLSSDTISDVYSEIHFTLEELKVFQNTSKTAYPNIEERLLTKYSSSKSKIEKQRIMKKSQEADEFKFIPEINKTSIRLSMPRYKSEVKMMLDSMRKIEPDEEEQAIRPSETIPKPDLNDIKEIFKSRDNLAELNKEEKPNLIKMNLIEKCKYYRERKSSSIQNALTRKDQEIMESCTFKPNLSKDSIKHRRSAQSLTEIFMTDERFKTEESARPPAPNPKINRLQSEQIENQKIVKSSKYSEISPAKRIYSFKEGVNIKDFINKSKPMLRYDTIS